MPVMRALAAAGSKTDIFNVAVFLGYRTLEGWVGRRPVELKLSRNKMPFLGLNWMVGGRGGGSCRATRCPSWASTGWWVGGEEVAVTQQDALPGPQLDGGCPQADAHGVFIIPPPFPPRQLTHPIDEHSPLRHYLPYFNRDEHGKTVSHDPATGLEVCVLPQHAAAAAAGEHARRPQLRRPSPTAASASPSRADAELVSQNAVKSHLSSHVGASAVAEPLVSLEIFLTFRVRSGGGRGHGRTMAYAA